ncbi:hypothetical protein PIB30_038415 [Stylosanthes scabra]|uniref:Uncharacterized protein n=1 Tax=Stylosanthes scabra TaxID=79078 RepID=A0ABU6VFH0_9FABA|nr:hypothetical protein [Stylosanthes scabra]
MTKIGKINMGQGSNVKVHNLWRHVGARATVVLGGVEGRLRRRKRRLFTASFSIEIIIACCLLQNFIRMNMDSDPEEESSISNDLALVGEDFAADMIDVVKNTVE